MRFSKFPPGHKFIVSAEDPQLFSSDDIKRFLELDKMYYRNNQDNSEWLRLRRSFAKVVNCPGCTIEVEDNTLIITIK